MKDYIDSPDRVVNVKGLDATITATPDGGMKIGSAVKIIDLYEHAQVAKLYPAINAAAIEIGTPQIRNQGTVGGNVNQRPRCWYYRNEEFVCYKKGGSRCFAVNGENQYHAIFGNDGPSHIVHPSSLAVPFVAYGARFRVLGPNGEREVAAADFFTLPTLQNVLKENVLEDEDILTHVILPAPGNVKTRALRGALQAVARLAARVHHGRADDEREHDFIRARRARRGGADPVAIEGGGSGARRQAAQRADGCRRRRGRGRGGEADERKRLQSADREDGRQAGHHERGRAARQCECEYRVMDHLTSPKLTPGVHCLNIRHKGMFVTSGPDPDEFTFYDKYDSTAYWCAETQRGFGPDGSPVRPDCCSGERDCCKH